MDIRETILEELKRRNESHYWLAKKADAAGIANEQTIYRYLRGQRDTAGSVIGGLLGLLGLKIRRNQKTSSKTTKRKRQLETAGVTQ